MALSASPRALGVLMGVREAVCHPFEDTMYASRNPEVRPYYFPQAPTVHMSKGFILCEEDAVSSVKMPQAMTLADINILTSRMISALWLIDVVLESGIRTEIYATYFKDFSHLHTVRWVFQEMRTLILAFLKGENYIDEMLVISKVPVFEDTLRHAEALVRYDESNQRWNHLYLSGHWFQENTCSLQDFHAVRAETEDYIFLQARPLPEVTLLHELAHMVSSLKWESMIQVANDPAFDDAVTGMTGSETGINDVKLGAVARLGSQTDAALLDIAAATKDPSNQSHSEGGSYQAYGIYAPVLAALENGNIAALLNADSYSTLAAHHAWLYLNDVLQPSEDLDFLPAEAELLTTIERFGLEADVIETLQGHELPKSRVRYVFERLSPQSQAIYARKREQVSQLLERMPSPLVEDGVPVWSAAGYSDCAGVPSGLCRVWAVACEPWWVSPGPDVYKTPEALHPERVTALMEDDSIVLPMALGPLHYYTLKAMGADISEPMSTPLEET